VGLILVTPPTEQPVLVEDLITAIHPVESGEENDLLESYIAAAAATAETYLRRALCAQQWQWSLDGFPGSSVLRPPKPPLISVDSIKYLDPDGALTTLDPAVYTVDLTAVPGRVALAWAQTWPSTRQELAAVRITFTAGWAKAKDLPEGIKAGMKSLIGTWYESRETVTLDGAASEIPDTVKRMWAPYRMPYFR